MTTTPPPLVLHCLDCLVQWMPDDDHTRACWYCQRPGRDGPLPADVFRRASSSGLPSA